jgi:hypothetical protein
MRCSPGHAAAGRLARIVAPAAEHAGRVLVGEIAFDMHDVADDAVGHHALEFAHRREAALVIAQRERHAGLGGGGNRDRRLGARQGQRLFRPDRLAGGGDLGNLLDMQRMRRGEKNRLHAGVGDGRVKVARQLEALGGGEIADPIGLHADAADEAQALALALRRFDDVLAPASEADNGGVDHGAGLG